MGDFISNDRQQIRLEKGQHCMIARIDADGDAVIFVGRAPFSCCCVLQQNFDKLSRLDREAMREQLHEVLSEWPTYGMFNIFMTHPGPLRVLPLLVLLAQIIIPLALVAHTYSKSEGGWCPGSAETSMKALMFGVSLVYAYRGAVTFAVKYASFTSYTMVGSDFLGPLFRNRLKKRHDHLVIFSKLNNYGQVDDFMDISYEAMISMLNLWLVFLAREPQDVVLNSLAMEFVAKLDDEFKEFYMGHFAQSVTNILDRKLHLPSFEDVSWAFMAFSYAVAWTNRATSVMMPAMSLLMLVYGPLCSP